MSLILEALRKSEAERQASQLPGLMSPAPTAAPRRASRLRWLILPAVLVAGLALGWLATLWLPFGDPISAPPDSTPTGGVEAPAPTPQPLNPRARQLAEQSAPSPPGTAAEVAPVDTLPAPPSPDVLQPAAPPPEPLPVPRAALAIPAQSAPAAAPMADSVRLALMPSAQREQLPPLRLTAHVYSDDPGRRFAIVDGRRVVEGDALGAGVTVKAIRRDGLLLDISQQPWLLERSR